MQKGSHYYFSIFPVKNAFGAVMWWRAILRRNGEVLISRRFDFMGQYRAERQCEKWRDRFGAVPF